MTFPGAADWHGFVSHRHFEAMIGVAFGHQTRDLISRQVLIVLQLEAITDEKCFSLKNILNSILKAVNKLTVIKLKSSNSR